MRTWRLGLWLTLMAAAARGDFVTLKNGEILEGKARQWGDKVRFWDRSEVLGVRLRGDRTVNVQQQSTRSKVQIR